MKWAAVIDDLAFGLLGLCIFLALTTNFWESVAARIRGRHDGGD